jgi:Ca-activated chloride channel homolog
LLEHSSAVGPFFRRMLRVLGLSQSVGFRICLASLATFALPSLIQAQSLDDVHVEPRQKQTAEPSPTDTVQSPGVQTPEVRLKPFRVDVDLVLVPVTVTDAMNHPVTALTKQDFVLYDEEKPQQIQYFFEDEEPVSVAVLLDVSQSMTNKIDTEREALEHFFRNANPEDEYFAITFSDQPRIIASSTKSIEEMQSQLMLAQPRGPTAMLDAIYLAESQLRKAKYKRRAIVIFSDGGDNVSHHSHREIISLVRESDVEVYAIGLFDTPVFGPVEEKLGKQWLSRITDCTGGRTIALQNRTKVSDAAAEISREMRSQYVLGYRPAVSRTGKWRKIKVRVASSTIQQPLHAFYKKEYLSLEK